MNNKNFSATQAANITAFAGIIVMIASKLGFEASTEDVVLVIGAAVSIWGVARSYWNRYKKGDVTRMGRMK